MASPLKVKGTLVVTNGAHGISIDLEPTNISNPIDRSEIAEKIGKAVAEAIGWLPDHSAMEQMRAMVLDLEKKNAELEAKAAKPEPKPEPAKVVEHTNPEPASQPRRKKKS